MSMDWIEPTQPARNIRSELSRDPLPLQGRSVVITGVSRRAGIGYATACRAAAYGANLVCHHYVPHDLEQPWGGDDIEAVLAGIRAHTVGNAEVIGLHADLTEESAPEGLIAAATERFGPIDGLVCNQALSGMDGALGELSAAALDRHWAVNTRASLLLAQAVADRHEAGENGSIVFLTSGQGLGPMPGEIGYAAAKAALAGVTATVADQLADKRIRVNTVNPGPVNTGYLTESSVEAMRPRFPAGRLAVTDDPARLIVWLLTDEAEWLTGQVINTEGGFRR